MAVQKVWKRVRCPKCQGLVRIRYATDGSWILQDSKPSLFPPNEQGNDDFEESVKKLIEARIKQHEESCFHE